MSHHVGRLTAHKLLHKWQFALVEQIQVVVTEGDGAYAVVSAVVNHGHGWMRLEGRTDTVCDVGWIQSRPLGREYGVSFALKRQNLAV